MNSHSPRMWCAAVILICLAATGTARAGTVDLFGLPGNFDQGIFGTSLSRYYAQSVLADDAQWSSLAFGVTNQGASNFNLIISEGRPVSRSGSGFLPDATAILSQQVLDHLGGGLQIFDVDLNLPVTSGTTYFFTLGAFGTPLSRSTVRATEFGGTDKYVPGEFIFSNINAAFSNGLPWNSRFGNGQDLVFRATFDASSPDAGASAGSVSVVFVPAALPLFASAVGVLGLYAWRQYRKIAS